MPKKKKVDVVDVDTGIKFDSTHELWFYWYLKELKSSGYIDKFRFNKTFELSHKVKCKKLVKNKSVDRQLLSSKVYTDDFGIIWNIKAESIFYHSIHNSGKTENLPFIANGKYSLIDIKNPYNKQGVKTLFSVNQKFMFLVHKFYVQDIDIQDLMAYTFTPERFKLTDSKRSERKINHNIRSLKKYVQIRKKLIEEYESRNER